MTNGTLSKAGWLHHAPGKEAEATMISATVTNPDGTKKSCPA
jgi:hypothetical protein